MTTILEFILDYSEYFILGIIAMSLIMFVLLIVLLIKNSRLKRKYNEFLQGSSGTNLEEIILSRLNEINLLKDAADITKSRIRGLELNQTEAYQKTGIVKYNAFRDLGGNLSFSLALLNEKNTGFILTSMHSREGCYTYIKKVEKGISEVQLSDEEKESLELAIKN